MSAFMKATPLRSRFPFAICLIKMARATICGNVGDWGSCWPGQANKYFKRFALANGSRKCTGTAAG